MNEIENKIDELISKLTSLNNIVKINKNYQQVNSSFFLTKRNYIEPFYTDRDVPLESFTLKLLELWSKENETHLLLLIDTIEDLEYSLVDFQNPDSIVIDYNYTLF